MQAHPLVSGPIVPTLLGLTWPNLVSMTTLMLVSIVETFVVGRLGLAELAAMSLVFPSIVLMQNLSGGSIGGGVSSSISRAIGRGRHDEAGVLAVHGLVIGAAFGLLFATLYLTLGPRLFRLLGGEGEVLAVATGFSHIVFAALPLFWVSNMMASVMRGTGNMRMTSRITVLTAFLQMALGALLGLGVGPFRGLGMTGVALAQVLTTLAWVAFGGWYVLSGRAGLSLKPNGRWPRLRAAVCRDILGVGLLSCLQPTMSMVIVMMVGRLVAVHGVEALAAYGIGARLEIILMSITYSVGGASIPLVGMAIGAGNPARARRVTWIAAGLAALVLGVVGAVLTVWPDLWIRVFTQDPRTLAAGRAYLQHVGPCLAFLGLGTSLYFSSQGAGRLVAPIVASGLRLSLVAGGGWWLLRTQAPLESIFALIGIAMTVYGIAGASAVRLTRWGDARASGGPERPVATA